MVFVCEYRVLLELMWLPTLAPAICLFRDFPSHLYSVTATPCHGLQPNDEYDLMIFPVLLCINQSYILRTLLLPCNQALCLSRGPKQSTVVESMIHEIHPVQA